MNTEQALAIFDTVAGSFRGAMTFPQTMGKLMEIGVVRYHADYHRREKTYYLSNGESLVVSIPWEDFPMGEQFSAEQIESAVRQSQRNEHSYKDFLRKTMAAACVGYFVLIEGQRAQYFGRHGEIHTEWFPGAKRD